MWTTIITFFKEKIIYIVVLLSLCCYIGYIKYDNLSLINDYESLIAELKSDLTTKEVQLLTTIQKYDSVVFEIDRLKGNIESFSKLIEEKNKTIKDLEDYSKKEIEKILNLKTASKEEKNKYDIISKESSDSIINDINIILLNRE